METTRATLLEKVRNCQPDAQKEFDFIYRPIIERYALQFVRSLDADVIVTDVIARFVLAPIQYDPEIGKFRHLLMVAVHRRWLDLLRERKRDPAQLPGNLLEGVQMVLAEITDDDCRNAKIRTAFASIRGDFEPLAGNIFERVHFDGERAVDVAADLGMTPNAVRQAAHCVMKRLRKELGQDAK